MYPGRWNERGQPVIYASEHYSTALLETLARTGEMPRNQHYVEIEIPAGVTYEVVTKDSLPGWCDVDGAVARAFGAAWYAERRSAILIVPSVVTRVERNVLIHPDHEDAGSISVGSKHRSTGIHDSSRDDGHTATPALASPMSRTTRSAPAVDSRARSSGVRPWSSRCGSVEKPDHCRFVVSPESPGFEQYTRDAMDALAHLACQMLT